MLKALKLFILFSFVLSLHTKAQEKINLTQAENLLQKNNLLLLAEQYNITASEASVIQAKIWEQPYISIELDAINPNDNSYFQIGNPGQKSLAIQQLLYIGGKKKNEIAFSKSNLKIAKIQFEQLLRDLKMQLYNNFYIQYFEQNKLINLNKQIDILDELIKNYNTQTLKGNVALKELARLQSLAINLKNDRNQLLSNIIESQKNLSLLTGETNDFTPIIDEGELLSKISTQLVSQSEVTEYAMQNNLDIILAQQNSNSQESYLNWQKSLNTPDLTAGLTYDQGGSVYTNQISLTFGISLPFWNKNKGNIKMAEAQLSQTKIQFDYKKLDLKTQAIALYNQWQQQRKLWLSLDNNYMKNINIVYDGILSNFQKRNISLLEFTDYMESYNSSSVQINEIKKNLILSALQINFITNKTFF